MFILIIFELCVVKENSVLGDGVEILTQTMINSEQTLLQDTQKLSNNLFT